MGRFTELLTATALGTYLLVVLGAMAATTDGVVVIAAGHHLAAVLLGVAIAALAVLAWVEPHDRRVRAAITAAAVAYPIQALVGIAGIVDIAAVGGQLHLLGGVGVFATLLLALVWHLDRELGGAAAGDPVAKTSSDPTASWLPEGIRAYVELTKPRLMWLLALLALAGMALATITGARLDGVTVVATLLGGVLAIGAAGTFNHVYERDRDRRMARTAERPLATDAVGVGRAVGFGLALLAASMAVLLTFVGTLAAALTAVAVGYYAVLYTVVLKPSTRWNTVLGGGAGALPAVIGWVAVTGSVGLPALLLAAVVFCWTPAHFYNLAIVYREDYERADYPMLPVVDGVATARRRIVYWLGGTLLVVGALGVVAGFGPVYAVTAALVGFGFARTVTEQFGTGGNRAAYRSFHASNAFLGAILIAILVETLVV